MLLTHCATWHVQLLGSILECVYARGGGHYSTAKITAPLASSRVLVPSSISISSLLMWLVCKHAAAVLVFSDHIISLLYGFVCATVRVMRVCVACMLRARARARASYVCVPISTYISFSVCGGTWLCASYLCTCVRMYCVLAYLRTCVLRVLVLACIIMIISSIQHTS